MLVYRQAEKVFWQMLLSQWESNIHVVQILTVRQRIFILTLPTKSVALYQRGQCPHPFLSPESKVHGANMGPTWGRQDPGGPHVGHVNLAIWVVEKSWLIPKPVNGLLIFNIKE